MKLPPPGTFSLVLSRRLQVAQPHNVGTLHIEPFLRVPLEIDSGSATPPNDISVRAWVETERGWLRAQVVGRVTFSLSPTVKHEAGGGVWLRGVPKRFLRLEFSAQGFETAKVDVADPSEDAPIRVRMIPN